MRFGMFYELQMPKPWSATAEYDTLWDAVRQVTYAEEMGFEQVWLVEHHFLPEFAHSSAPEVTLAVMAQNTSKMRLGFGVVLAPVHHPLHVAARAATLAHFQRRAGRRGRGPDERSLPNYSLRHRRGPDPEHDD